MRLIISEKADLAKNVANAVGATTFSHGYYEGNGFIVVSAVGHLFETLKPDAIDPRYSKWILDDLPIIPETIPKQLKTDYEKKFNLIKSLAMRSDVNVIYNNGDSDAEGQLLIQEILDHIPTKKPVLRIWNSSMNKGDICRAVKDAKPDSEYENLLRSAEARTSWDWMFGMNMSRLYSILGNAVLQIGRVKTTLLNEICRKAFEVENFKPVPYYEVAADNGDITLVRYAPDGTYKIGTKAEAEKIKTKIDGKTGKITSVTRTEEKLSKPSIYDTSALQIDANIIFGIDPSDTSAILESLYMAGITSYPRTDCCYLFNNMRDDFDKYIDLIGAKNPKAAPLIAKMKSAGYQYDYVFNDKKVEEHTGIILCPGYENCDLSDLPDDSQKVLSLITTRMLEVCAPASTYYKLVIEADVDGELLANTQTSMKTKGFLIFREILLGKTPKESKTLPNIAEGTPFIAETVSVLEKFPTKPQYYTKAGLIKYMKNIARESPKEYRKVLNDVEGIGTGATRDIIIKELLTVKSSRPGDMTLCTCKGNYVIPTEKGRYLVSIVPENLKSPVLTAKMEIDLNAIRKGKLSKTDFMNSSIDILKDLVKTGKASHVTPMSNTGTGATNNVVGKCPRCGKDVFEGQKSFSCVGYKDKSCSFAIWKDNKLFTAIHKKLTVNIVKSLLGTGRAHLTGLTSKNGNKYDADLIMKDDGTRYVNFEFEFPEKKQKRKKAS